MNRVLITGVNGFVGKHLLRYLLNSNNCLILGISKNDNFDIENHKNCSFVGLDLLDFDKLNNEISKFRPNYVFHLASFSSVSGSWLQPEYCFRNNMNAFLNLLESIRINKVDCRILSVGSSETYENIKSCRTPLAENVKLAPHSPYGLAKMAEEYFSKIYVKNYGLDIVMTRSFNHIGIGQKDFFLIPSIVKQLKQFEKNTLNYLDVGNIEIIRDFTDVRDVVRAYVMLLENGIKGEVYNVCSGKGIAIKDLINKLIVISGKKIEIRIINELIRPRENNIIIGSNNKIFKEIGWKPERTINESLKTIYKNYQ